MNVCAPLNTTTMLIIDGTTDLADATKRLVRLMYNIERGAKVYEWTSGSASEPLLLPGPNPLTIEVPGVTTGAPPAAAELCPSVGYVYYVPGAGFDVSAFVRRLQALCADLPDDHLTGFLPVETAPHVTLLHRGRIQRDCIQREAQAFKHSDPATTKWLLSKTYPPRCFYVIQPTSTKKHPSHVSYRGGFTWYVAPVTVATRLHAISTFEEFNALVSSVFFDTLFGSKELPFSVYGLTSEHLGVLPLPAAVAKLTEKSARDSVILARIGDRLEAVGACLFAALSSWQDPDVCVAAGSTPAVQPSQVANLSQPGIIRSCGFCELPLWGDVYAVADEAIAPYYMAVCRWCCGCFPPERRAEAVKVSSGQGLREAFRGTFYERFLPLLEARVSFVGDRDSPTGFLLLEGGERVVFAPAYGSLDTALPSLRGSSLMWPRVAILN